MMEQGEDPSKRITQIDKEELRFFNRQFRCLCLYTRQCPPRERLRSDRQTFRNPEAVKE
jgi:hypothetical protein